MTDGRVPPGERYVQLNILDMFRNRNSSSSGNRRPFSTNSNSNSNSSAGRGESSGSPGPVRNRHGSSSRHTPHSISRGHRERNRDSERDRSREEPRHRDGERNRSRDGSRYQGQGHRLDEREEVVDDASSMTLTDSEMADAPPSEPTFYQGTSRMLRMAGGSSAGLQRLNKMNAPIVVKEAGLISKAVFAGREDTMGYVYNGIDIKPLGKPYCPEYRLPEGDPDHGKIGCRIQVVNQDTILCAEEMVKRHNFEQSQMKIARSQGNTEPNMYPVDNGVIILNMANADKKGGGFLNGSVAQEEAIMHRCTLWTTLRDDFYPMTDTEGIYSPFVVIYKKLAPDPAAPTGPGTYQNLHRAQAILDALNAGKIVKDANNMDLPGPPLPEIAVISLAAINGPKIRDKDGKRTYVYPQEKSLTEMKIRQILRMAALNGHRRLVLGALGCGVFKNPNEVVAQMFLDILKEPEFQGGWWKEITFACYDPPRADGTVPSNANSKVFEQILGDQIV
ncbi:hypothetical protein TWF694_001069 [Orbilia ellipsospora]|uniref:Microbial-type PARG catalytic domain-containing protein n=1 Tax=Orbilia ellipsospora TaxID=2528407 RepID=A0AAV9XX53_9PEZI